MARKAGLGKGLGALMQESGVSETTESPSGVAISKIKPNASQPRESFDQEELSQLADSIKQNGILQPLLVRPVKGKDGTVDSYEIIAGERRYQAAKKAGLKELPVVIREVDDHEAYKLALIENLQRMDLDPIEEAKGYKHLMQAEKLNQSQIAEAVSKSRPYVANALRLLDLPDEVQAMLAEGLLTPGHARAILAVPDDDARLRLAKRVVENNLTVRQTETLAPLFSGGSEPPARRQPAPASYKRAARQLRDALGASVRVKQVRGKNKIEIEFIDEEDLARLVTSIVRWGGGNA